MRPSVLSITSVLLCLVPSAVAVAGPDLICSHIGWPVPGDDIKKWGTVGGINGYTIATFGCNIGDEPLPWDGFSSQHPLVIQNLYRVHDGRFEQIGMSWTKHGTAVVATGLNCGSCPVEGQGSFELVPGCADPYNATANGDQLRMGPRSEIDPFTGVIPFPHGSAGVSGDAIFKRLQVHNDDLDPALNPGARYFIEAQYVSEADSAAGNDLNNVSHREVFVGAFVDGGWELEFGAPGTVELPAIYAWQTVVPSVTVTPVDVPGDGRLILAYDQATTKDFGTGLRYVIFNQNSSRAVRSFHLPYINDYLGQDLFNDVDYHSGETSDATDWFFEWLSHSVGWTVIPATPANSLRWGTAYSFELMGTPAPVPADVTIELDGGAEPMTLLVPAIAPEPLILDCVAQLLPLCADANSDGIRDDPCQWVGCDNLACAFIPIPFGDMGGPFGACMVDGTADGNDRFHALNCFSNNNPNGPGAYPCESNTPQAYNVDTGGPFGSCDPDGVCDGNDAFAALNAFAGTTTCSCPLGEPAPTSPAKRRELIISRE